MKGELLHKPQLKYQHAIANTYSFTYTRYIAHSANIVLDENQYFTTRIRRAAVVCHLYTSFARLPGCQQHG